MDGSRLSPYPHLSWFAFGLTIRSPQVFLLHEYRAVTHRLMVTEEGDAHLAWATGAANETCHVTVGSLVFLPGDSARHSIGITAPEGYRGHEVLVPIGHLESVCEAEGVGHMTDSRLHSVFRDTLLLACVLRLLAGSVRGHLAEDVGTEIAARQAIMRLAVLGGGRPPAWRKDASTFPPRVMTLIVERVDAHLKAHPSLEEISSGFGLSPSHFARKFQHSTGLSLNRFINRRRIGLSLASLKTGGESLAQLSLDLGFSSQSHFTRLFSSLVGVTPHQFRRTQRRNGD
jgi:AraC-like DNA-binding protein